MKLFEEVFPTLRLKGEMKALFERVQVERISAPKDRKFLRIYLGSEHLIEKDKINTCPKLWIRSNKTGSANPRGINTATFPATFIRTAIVPTTWRY